MNLEGRWLKLAGSPAAAGYPDELEFRAGGLYRGVKGPTGADFTWWDAGTWELRGDGEVAISTANDEVISYSIARRGDILEFVDPDGVRFAYRRDASGPRLS